MKEVLKGRGQTIEHSRMIVHDRAFVRYDTLLQPLRDTPHTDGLTQE